MTPKPGFPPCPGISMEGTYLLAMRGPAYRRHDSYLGFRAELENRVGAVKGKRHKWRTHEAESTDAPTRGALLRSSDEAGQCPWSKGSRSPTSQGVNGQPEELLVLMMEGGSLHWVARAG